jgi:hypothetical protein
MSKAQHGSVAQYQDGDGNVATMDMEQFDKDCARIIATITERFIDMAPVTIDDENEKYLELLFEKQSKFKTELDSKFKKGEFKIK